MPARRKTRAKAPTVYVPRPAWVLPGSALFFLGLAGLPAALKDTLLDGELPLQLAVQVLSLLVGFWLATEIRIRIVGQVVESQRVFRPLWLAFPLARRTWTHENTKGVEPVATRGTPPRIVQVLVGKEGERLILHDRRDSTRALPRKVRAVLGFG